MNKLAKKSTAIALSLAAVMATAVTAPAASAAEYTCPTGFSCVWTQSDFREHYSGRGNSNYTEYYIPGGRLFNDTISSLRNYYPGTKRWYEHENRGGAVLPVGYNTRITNLQNPRSGLWYHPDWNDLISSVD